MRPVAEVAELILNSINDGSSEKRDQHKQILLAIIAAISSIDKTTSSVDATNTSVKTDVPNVVRSACNTILSYLEMQMPAQTDKIINVMQSISQTERQEIVLLFATLLSAINTNNEDVLKVLKDINSKLTPPEPIIIEKEVIKYIEIPVEVPITIEEYEKKIKELNNEIERLCGCINKQKTNISHLNAELSCRPKTWCC